MLQLTFNPGLTLTGIRTTRPCVVRDTVRLTCFCGVFYSLEIHGGPPVPRRLPPEESECALLI